MTQIILDGNALPEASFDKYSCKEEPLKRQMDMVNGRRVSERIGLKWLVWRAQWAYDTLDDSIYRQIRPLLLSAGPILASVLPDGAESEKEMVTSSFFVESFTTPTYLIADGGKAVWHNIAFSLREEEPHA